MTTQPRMLAFRLTSPRFLLTAIAALVAVAAPASALLGLPVGLPGVAQQVDTPAGSIDASASESGAYTCADLYTPALPAAPALPAVPSLPVPVAVPAIPALPAAPSAGANYCASAGLDGASADVGLDAAGRHAGTGIQAESPVSQDEVESTVDETSDEAQGFFAGLIDTLFGWI